ncbi:MAG: GtrA family protein [Pseudomonadales bacterium]
MIKSLDQFLSEVLRVSRFGVVGVIATFVHLLTFSLLMEFTNVGALVATIIAFLIAFSVTFFGNFYWTFERTNPELGHIVRMVTVAGCGLVLNMLIAVVVVDYLSLPYLVAAIGMLATPVITYFGMKVILFDG